MKLKINTGLMWISVAVAVIFAIWITKSATPLWAFLIPVMVGRLDY